jgi:intein/homing endonuclease
VIVDDPTTLGEIEKRQVLVAYERQATTLIDIYVDGEIISATEEHPIWVVDKGWVEPKDIQVGDLLQTEDGRVVDVDKIEKRDGEFKVYNFRVEGIPTYFVSDLGILVHNNTNCPTPNPSQQTNIDRFIKKAPSNSKDNIEIRQLPNEGVAVQATSPGRVPGSKAVYEKQIDVNGKTVQYTKTTYDPQGNIIHVKDKINGGELTP